MPNNWRPTPNDESRFIIYGLVDPRTRLIRYVGKSSSGLRRPMCHALVAERCFSAAGLHVHRWIRSLHREGLDYEIAVLESFGNTRTEQTRPRLNDAERFWIAYLRGAGCDLTNILAGGDGGALPGPQNPFWGKRHSEETRARISATKLGCAPTRGTTGMKFPEEVRAKMRGLRPNTAGANHPMFGRHHSQETREMISARGRGRMHSPETKKKMSEARKAFWERKRNGNSQEDTLAQ